MSGVILGVLGAQVTVHPASGSRTVLGRFREEPIEIDGPEGQPVLIQAPTLQVQETEAAGMVRDVEIEVADGRRFAILSGIASASPAADRLVTFELRKV